jgi:hypothetical protein
MGKRSRRRDEPEAAEAASAAPVADGDGSAATATTDASDGAAPDGNGDGATARDGGRRSSKSAPEAGGGRPQGDLRLREALEFVEEADMLSHLYRWTVLTGDLPRPEDWLPHEDWPHPDAVQHVFGSWNKFIEHSGLKDAPPLLRARALSEREQRLDGRARALEREERRQADLRRQLDVARRKRAEAEALRDEQARRVAGLEGRLTDTERRAADAEQRIAGRRADAERTAEAAPDGEPSDEWLRAHEAAIAELDQVRAHREELLRRTEQLEAEAERQREAIGRLSALLGTGGEESRPAEGAADEDAPTSVLEAVRIARETLPHLIFTEAADESAADSPYRRPGDILDTLRRLDRLAELHADPAGFGTSLTQAAQELGLSWRAGVSELARNRWPNAYTITHDGRSLELGPHVAIGSGSGAGFVARIYLHVADGSGDAPRGFYVGHVGRHLPDTTT